MYGITYSQAPTLEKSFCRSFHDVIQSASSYEYYDVQAQIFSSLVELLFLPALATVLVLISRLTILRESLHSCFAFYHDIVVFHNLLIF